MKIVVLVSLFALLATSHAEAEAIPTTHTPAPVVFFDIAGPDAAKLKTFYAANFGWGIDAANGITTPTLKGTLRQDPPATLIYLGVPDIDATLKAITASGGSTMMPKMVMSGVTFALFKDPAAT